MKLLFLLSTAFLAISQLAVESHSSIETNDVSREIDSDLQNGVENGVMQVHPHRDLSSSTFRLRMYWKRGYRWQEKKDEKKWCMQCRGSSCKSGRKIRIRKCKSTSRQLWEYYKGNKKMIKTKTKNLCLTRSGSRIYLEDCDSDDDDQQFCGFKSGGDKFEINPCDKKKKCLSQQHHPRENEKIKTVDCKEARRDTTSYWRLD